MTLPFKFRKTLTMGSFDFSLPQLHIPKTRKSATHSPNKAPSPPTIKIPPVRRRVCEWCGQNHLLLHCELRRQARIASGIEKAQIPLIVLEKEMCLACGRGHQVEDCPMWERGTEVFEGGGTLEKTTFRRARRPSRQATRCK